MSCTREPIERRAVERVHETGARSEDHDQVAIEGALEIRCQGEPLTVVMRTPGHDEELARGLLFAEGVIQSSQEARAVGGQRDGGDDDVVEIDLPLDHVRERWPERSLVSTSSCGVCGARVIAALEELYRPVRSSLAVAFSVVAEAPERMRAEQAIFADTGGVHAAGLFGAGGQLVAVREDVGRHNAVDKLVGWALTEELIPLGEQFLCVSGRISFEIVHKAIAARVPVVVAVSAPTSLAIDMAERFGVTLCAFVRGGRFNIYSHRHRIRAS